MYPHLLRKAEQRFARAGISQKPKPVYEPVPPPFVMADGAVGCVLSRAAPTTRSFLFSFLFGRPPSARVHLFYTGSCFCLVAITPLDMRSFLAPQPHLCLPVCLYIHIPYDISTSLLLHTHRSPPAKEFGRTKGKVAVPTGADGGTLNIYSYNEFEKAKAEGEFPSPKQLNSLDGGGGRARVHQPSRPTPFGLGGAYDLPEREISQYDHGSNSLYHPGVKFAAPAGKVVHAEAPDEAWHRTACVFNRERKKGILTQAHPLVKGNGDILGHDGAALYNKHMVDVKKVGDEEFEEKRYRRNLRKTDAVKKWARRKADGHHMKSVLAQEHVAVRDNPSHYLFARGRY